MKRAPGADGNHLIHWSYVGAGVPWKHAPWWQPAPAKADRIAALEQQLKGLMEAQSVLAAALVKRLEALEGMPPDGRSSAKVPGGIAALANRLKSLETLFWAHNHPASITHTTPAVPQP